MKAAITQKGAYEAVLQTCRDHTVEIKLGKNTKAWAKKQGWPTPWLNFETAFLGRILGNHANGELAIVYSGADVYVPASMYDQENDCFFDIKPY